MCNIQISFLGNYISEVGTHRQKFLVEYLVGFVLSVTRPMLPTPSSGRSYYDINDMDLNQSEVFTLCLSTLHTWPPFVSNVVTIVNHFNIIIIVTRQAVTIIAL